MTTTARCACPARFSERATVSQYSVVEVEPWRPLETAVLACCGVPTGWGIANDAGGVRAGDSVVGYGIGGGDDQGGHLKLDELVTNRYSLEAVNEGYQDLRDGKNIRGIVVHDAS